MKAHVLEEIYKFKVMAKVAHAIFQLLIKLKIINVIKMLGNNSVGKKKDINSKL
jgi:hypothetical protein